MFTFLTILIVIASIILVLLVLVQNSKGGGLASGFSSQNQIMGVRKTTDFLEKSTWTVIAAIVVMSIIASGVSKRTSMTTTTSSIAKTAERQKSATEQPLVNFNENFPVEEGTPAE